MDRIRGSTGRSIFHPPERSRQHGFTLLEIIVVVVLIAISATFVVVNLERDADGVAELEAKRFASLIEQARDESILSGRPYAVEVDPKLRSYEFFQHDREWKSVKGDDVFRSRRIAKDLEVAFRILDSPESSGMLIIEGLGEITPFQLTIRGDQRVYTVSIDESQNLKVSNAAQ